MKFDRLGCLIRERYQPDDHWANLGESCAETARALILGQIISHYGKPQALTNHAFHNPDGPGFVRHPLLKDVHGWDEADMSGDAFIVLFMAYKLIFKESIVERNIWKIPGTNTWLTPAAWCLVRGHYRLLNLLNIAQGILFRLDFRWSDDGHLESADGKVQDWLNFVIIYLYLRELNNWATLAQPKQACMTAIAQYYLQGDDKEPNSEWIVRAYSEALEAQIPA